MVSMNPQPTLSTSSSRASVSVSAMAIAAVLSLSPWTTPSAVAQGCVASRAGSCFLAPGIELHPHQGFSVAAGYRWLHSDRHFTGDHEEVHRQEEGSEVINDSHFVDLSLNYAFTPRYSATLTLPFSLNDRSQVVRSNDVQRTILQRFATQSAGLGDIRLTGNAWVRDPEEMPKWNLLVGLGADMPTGAEDATDTFQAFDATSRQIVARERTVDQSIQPGDGGWGIIYEIYGYYRITDRLNAYLNGVYTMTPEEKNGVPTFRSNPYESIMSIADTYLGRVGFDYAVMPSWGLSMSLGGRIEGVPVNDALGGSEGFRRPGFSIGIEPSVNLTRGNWMFGVSTPVALYRNREVSVPDKQLAAATGIPRHGDAAFADYLVMATISRRF